MNLFDVLRSKYIYGYLGNTDGYDSRCIESHSELMVDDGIARHIKKQVYRKEAKMLLQVAQQSIRATWCIAYVR